MLRVDYRPAGGYGILACCYKLDMQSIVYLERMTIPPCRLVLWDGMESKFGGTDTTCKVWCSLERMAIALCRLVPREGMESDVGRPNSTFKV